MEPATTGKTDEGDRSAGNEVNGPCQPDPVSVRSVAT
jgi:hypothetical protein